jgi:hypothetical protein
MQKFGIKIIIIIFLTISVSETAQAQNDRRLVNDFHKLEQYVIRIADLVNNIQDTQARQFIVKAVNNLEQARRYLFQVSPPRITLAKFHMLSAKTNTDRAAKLILLKPLTYLKSQLDDQINRAERAVSASGSDEAHYLLNQAKKYRLWSYTSFQRNQLARGQEYFRIAYFFAKKCLDFVSSAGKDLSTQIADLETNIRQLLIEAEELVRNSENPQLQNLLEDANKYFGEALNFAENGEFNIALKRLQLIKRLLYRIFDMVDREDTNIENRLENNLYSLRSFLESIANEIKDNKNPQINTMLQKAWELYRQAEQVFEAKRFEQVKPKIAICQRLANRILQISRRSQLDNIADLKRRAEETHRILQMLADNTDFSNKPQLKSVFEEANRLLEMAATAIEQNQSGRAFQLIQIATRMAARIQREAKSDRAEFKRVELEKTYQRIQNMLRRLQESGDVPPQFMTVLHQLSSFAEKGREYLVQGNLVLADEYFNSVLVQIKQLTSKWQK